MSPSPSPSPSLSGPPPPPGSYRRGPPPLRSQTTFAAAAAASSASAPLHLQHLQDVATWASSIGPLPLAAFLGSRLSSSCHSLGRPPPPSPHTRCQRCESVLVVGSNCSVRVKPSKKLSSAAKTSKPINNVVYTCCYCSFENANPGTPKAYVRGKLAEVAACRSTLTGKSCTVDVFTPSPSPQAKHVEGLLITPGTGKKSRRKGWLTLKDLAASSIDSTSLANKKSASFENLTKSPGAFQQSPLNKRRAKSMASPSPLSLPFIIEDKPAERNPDPMLASEMKKTVSDVIMEPIEDYARTEPEHPESYITLKSLSDHCHEGLDKSSTAQTGVSEVPKSTSPSPEKQQDMDIAKAGQSSPDTLPSLILNKENEEPHVVDKTLVGISSDIEMTTTSMSIHPADNHDVKTLDPAIFLEKSDVCLDSNGEKVVIRSHEISSQMDGRADKEKFQGVETSEYCVVDDGESSGQDGDQMIAEEQTPVSKVDYSMNVEDITDVAAAACLINEDISGIQGECPKIGVEPVAQTNDSAPIEIKEIEHVSPDRTGNEHVPDDRALVKVGTTDIIELPGSVENAKEKITHGISNVKTSDTSDQEIVIDKNDPKDDKFSTLHNKVTINSPGLSRVLDPIVEASVENREVSHGKNDLDSRIPVKDSIATFEENVSMHPLERSFSDISNSLDIPTDAGLNVYCNDVNMQTSDRKGVNDISNAVGMQYVNNNGLERGIETQAIKPSVVSGQENTESSTELEGFAALQDKKALSKLEETLAKVNNTITAKKQESKLFATLQDKAVPKFEETLAKINDTLTANKQDAELLRNLQRSVQRVHNLEEIHHKAVLRKQKIGRLKLENLFSSKHSNIEEKLSLLDEKYNSIEKKLLEIPNLQNEVHHLLDQVTGITNAINQLRQELREEHMEAMAAKSDQVAELMKAFDWLKDRLACQPPNLGGFLTEEISPYVKNGHMGSISNGREADVLRIEAAADGSSRKRSGAIVNMSRPAKRQKKHKENLELHPLPTDKDNETYPVPTGKDNEIYPVAMDKDNETYPAPTDKDSENGDSMSPGVSKKKNVILTKVGRHWFCLSKPNRKTHSRIA